MTLCIGLLSLGITVYEESIVMNGSEFLSRVYTLGTCAFRLQLNVVLSPFPLSNSLSLFLSLWSLFVSPPAFAASAGFGRSRKRLLGRLESTRFLEFFLDNIRYYQYQDSEDGILYIWVAESGLFGNLGSEQTNRQELVRLNKTGIR